MASSKNKDKDIINWKPIILIGGLVGLVWLFTLLSFLIGENYGIIKVGDRGTFGDMFGGLNALFTGLAFGGIIFTILLQREDLKEQRKVLNLQLKELELQRQELKLTQKTLEAQRLEMHEQNKTLQVQRFENTFFSLLDTFNQTINSFKYGDFNGREVFEYFGRTFTEELKLSEQSFENTFNTISSIINNGDQIFGIYFRTFFNVIRFVQSSNFIEKNRYTDIIRDQLTNAEVNYLYFYGLLETKENNYGYKSLIERFSLLANMNASKLDIFCKNKYLKKAYKKTNELVIQNSTMKITSDNLDIKVNK